MAKRDSNGNPLGKSRGLGRKSAGVADWEQVDASLIKDAIVKAALIGGALRFGYTGDGGAYAIGIYGDGAPYTEYVKPTENIEDILRDVIQLYEDLADDRKNGDKAK